MTNYIDYDEEKSILQKIELKKNMLNSLQDIQNRIIVFKHKFSEIYGRETNLRYMEKQLEKDLMILRDELAIIRGE